MVPVQLQCKACKNITITRLGARFDRTYASVFVRRCKECGCETAHEVVNAPETASVS